MFQEQTSVGLLLFILVLLTLKHYVADYQFQPQVLADAKTDSRWTWAISLHSAVHAALTMIVLFPMLTYYAVLLFGLIDFCLHFLIDYWKSQKAGKYTPAQRKFWLLLGVDQTLHHLTYIAIAYMAVRFAG